ncbi:MAG: tetratricopeptide (TPR) repeat protein [Myxococcota bacterium]|jgi:tetratricopeptide (TPR) repeat protein
MKCQVARYLIFSLILGGCTSLFGERRLEVVITPQEYSAINQQMLPSPLRFSYDECRFSPQLITAMSSIGEGNFADACIYLQKARSVQNTSMLAALHIWCLAQNGNLDASRSLLSAAVSEMSVDQHLAYAGAVISEQAADYALAYSLYLDLFSLNDEQTILEACARTALASGQAQKCINHLDRLMLSSEMTIQHSMMRAKAYAQLERYYDAMSILHKMLADWPNDSALLRQTAMTLFDHAQLSKDPDIFADASTVLQALVELDPQYAAAFLALGQCYVANEAVNEAIAAFERCIELEPDNVEASHALSAVYLSYNDQQLAQSTLLQLLDQPIGAVQRQQTLDKLNKIK